MSTFLPISVAAIRRWGAGVPVVAKNWHIGSNCSMHLQEVEPFVGKLAFSVAWATTSTGTTLRHRRRLRRKYHRLARLCLRWRSFSSFAWLASWHFAVVVFQSLLV